MGKEDNEEKEDEDIKTCSICDSELEHDHECSSDRKDNKVSVVYYCKGCGRKRIRQEAPKRKKRYK